MKTIWHVFLKDARRLALPLLVWVVLGHVTYAVMGWTMGGSRAEEMVGWRAGGFGVATLEWMFVWLLLVALLIHADPLTDTRAFWVTRPISGRQLFGAKMLGLVVLVTAGPAAVGLPWWIGWNFGWGECLALWADSAALFGAFALAALPVAVLTRDLRGFVLWGVLVAILVALFQSLLVPVILGGLGAPPAPLRSSTPPAWAAALAIVLVTVGAGTAAQFVFRRTGRTMVVFVLGAVAALVALTVWPPHWRAPQDRGTRSLEQTGYGSLRAAGVTPHLGVSAQVDGLPPAMGLEIDHLEIASALPGGRKGVHEVAGFARGLLRQEERASEWMRWEHFAAGALLSVPDAPRAKGPARLDAGIAVSRAKPGSWPLPTGARDGLLHLHLLQAEEAGRLPLRPSAELVANGRTYRVFSVKSGTNSVAVGMFERRVAGRRRPTWSAVSRNAVSGFVLFSPSRQTFVPAEGPGTSRTSFAGLELVHHTLVFHLPPATQAAEWLNDAVIVKFDFRPVARIAEPVSLPVPEERP